MSEREDEQPEHDAPVDWGRYRVDHSRAAVQDPQNFTALGDPSAWSGSGQAVARTVNVLAKTPQLIRVQTSDPYARNWQMAGTVKMSAEVFDIYTGSVGSLDFLAVLDIELGVGMRDAVMHRVNLKALMKLASDPVKYATDAQFYDPVPQGTDIVVPWVMPGGLLGRSVNVFAQWVVTSEEAITLPQTLEITAAISPYSAGHGL